MRFLDQLRKKIFSSTSADSGTLDFESFERETALRREGSDSLASADSTPTLKDVLEEKVSQVGDKVLAAGKEMKGKISTLGDQVADKAGDLLRRAEEEAAREKKDTGEGFWGKVHRKGKEIEEKAADPNRNFQDSLRDGSKSTLDDTFFAKASRYAGGDYSAFGSGSVKVTKAGTASNSDKDKDPDAGGLIEDAIIEK